MKKLCVIFGAGEYYGCETLPAGEFSCVTADGGYTASCLVVGDDELPQITKLQPASGATIGPDYRDLFALTHDNTGTEKIELKFRKKGTTAWTEETWSDRDEDDRQDSVIQITLKLQDQSTVLRSKTAQPALSEVQ